MKKTRSKMDDIKTHLLDEVSSLSHESIIVCNHEKNIIKVNHAFTSITGYQQDEVVGVSINSLSSNNHNINFHETIWYQVKNNGVWQGELWSQRKNGDIYPEWRSVSVIYDKYGNVDCYIAISMDLSDKKGFEDRIHQLVHYDQLTKLPNKSLLKQLLSMEITKSQKKSKQLAILFLDLDGFKRINDSMGHQTGDNLLNIMAQRLRHYVRNKDIVSRWGSDDFIIVMPDISHLDEVTAILQHIHDYLLEPISLLEHKQLVISTSIGISLYPADGNNSMTLIQNASMARNKAKKNGGNCYKFYTTEMNLAVIERLSIETGLCTALERDQFELYYQPIIDLQSLNITGAEALIRWNHPQKGQISPDKFIPIAEDSGLIIAIGKWVLYQACAQCKQWQQDGHNDISISVNLSAKQFRDINLSTTVRDALYKSGLDPSYLTLELTESAIMDNVNQTIESLLMLKDIGVSLSIDDFGTGYSSLAYLKRFPIDKIKIDRSFVQDIDRDTDDKSIVQSIIAMGHGLKLSVVAEGLEKKEHLNLLSSEYCAEAQGYYISKPLCVDKFNVFIRQWINKSHRKPYTGARTLYLV